MKFPTIFGKEKLEAAGSLVNFYNDKVFLERPDLSYLPDNPRIKPGEENVYQFLFHYVQPGKELAFEVDLLAYIRFLKSQNTHSIAKTFQLIVGDNNPLYVVEIYGKDLPDVFAHFDEEFKPGGSEGKALRQKLCANLRAIETKNGFLRRDLSTLKFSKNEN